MTIQLELTAEQEVRLLVARDEQDELGIHVVLDEAVRTHLATWIPPRPPLTLAEFDALVDELNRELDSCPPNPLGGLPDSAMTREGIYGDHP